MPHAGSGLQKAARWGESAKKIFRNLLTHFLGHRKKQDPTPDLAFTPEHPAPISASNRFFQRELGINPIDSVQ
jgi:hypothetical protein